MIYTTKTWNTAESTLDEALSGYRLWTIKAIFKIEHGGDEVYRIFLEDTNALNGEETPF